MKEPIATITNVAFSLVAGIIIINDPAQELLAFSIACLGIFSGAFHAGASEHNTPAHRADEGAIYVVLGSLTYLAYNSDIAVLGLMAIIISGLLLFLHRVNLFLVVPIFVCLIIVGICIHVVPPWPLWVTIGAAATLGLRVIKQDDQPDWLHGLFHLVAAGTFYLTWHAVFFHSVN